MSNHRSAPGLVALLRARHKDDIFVSECKLGATNAGDATSPRMDAFALKRSWTHPVTTGYEIKVSRSDFLRDDKWRAYLPACNLFSFVVPSLDVCRPEEIPEGIGLLVTAGTGTRFTTKRRPTWKEADPGALLNVCRYILFWRAGGFCPEWSQPGERGLEYWRNHFAEEKLEKEFGRQVRGALGRKYSEHVTAVRTKQVELEKRLERFAAVEALLKRLGIDSVHYQPERRVAEQLKRLEELVPTEVVERLRAVERELGFLLQTIDRKKADGAVVPEPAREWHGVA